MTGGAPQPLTGKRVCDLTLSAVMLVTTAPVFAVVAVFQRIQGVPVLWRSPRVGVDGHIFELLSFRTMRDRRADDRVARLTPVGRTLRKYSLDHLPTLFNVLRGDMSLVGPRPMEPDRVDLEDPIWRRVVAVRPGMVSYAILSLAREYNISAPERRLRLEAKYVDRASFGFDAQLLLRAAGALVRSRGNVKARGRPAPW